LDLPARDTLRLVRRCLELAADTAVRIVVNDRVDIALAGRAHGIHLREASIAAAEVRRLMPDSMTIGRSVHSVDGARLARDADYLIAGTVFRTGSKPDAVRSLGVDGLAEIVAAAGDRPIWAVGGVTRENARAVRAAGARGVAAIGAFVPRESVGRLRESTEELTKLFRFSLTPL
jgi:thiamine-phosphate pyrophosphorylase